MLYPNMSNENVNKKKLFKGKKYKLFSAKSIRKQRKQQTKRSKNKYTFEMLASPERDA